MIIVSVVLVVGIYLWTRRRGRRRSMGRLIIEPQAPRASHEGDAAEPAPRISAAVEDRDDPLDVLIQAPQIEDEGPRIVNPDTRRTRSGPTARRKGATDDRTQLELGFDTPMRIDESFEDEPERSAAPGRGKPEPPAHVIVFYVEVAEPRRIGGIELLDALRRVGLQHGDMQIFHHFGVGQMSVEEPLFSVANMFEPGEFDLSKIHTISTRGVAMFMRMPTALDGPVAFELMLNTAQRLAEILQAQLCDDDHRALSAETIDEIRDSVANYERQIT